MLAFITKRHCCLDLLAVFKFDDLLDTVISYFRISTLTFHI